MIKSLNENFLLRVKAQEASLASLLKSSLVIVFSKFVKSPEINEISFLGAAM